ncbi:4-hydroxy-tetrahydrodipicolinate synthase [Candidatus Fermentibacteria bacterium]|nr:4-hydroxy-tetrahydrodipicolinate synthase [Candidatus Fermentibacteria bacterium]
MPALSGSLVALVTPFRPDGGLDEPALKTLVRRQLAEGTDGIVPCGTTGEGATLSEAETDRVVSLVVQEVDGRIPVVAGAGSNDTRVAVARAKRMKELGADAVLSVAPYYNKPTQQGLYEHFRTIAEDCGIPVVVYNVPGRTASNILPETMVRLADLPNIVAVKEASGNLVQIMEILSGAPGFTVLSGDDALTLPMLLLGAKGVISVVANEAPGLMHELVRAGLEGDWAVARELHFKLLPLMQANFLESNPIPVKGAVALLGLITETYRLPLVSPSQKTRNELQRLLYVLGLLKPEGEE